MSRRNHSPAFKAKVAFSSFGLKGIDGGGFRIEGSAQGGIE